MLSDYHYGDDLPTHSLDYLTAPVLDILRRSGAKHVFEIGAGNGAFAAELTSRGYDVIGVEPSRDGVRFASARGLNVQQYSTDHDLAARFGKFPIVLSLEVIEHVYSPKRFAERVGDLLEPNGIAVISTPYHGCWKNLALAVTGRMDNHHGPLWEGGHQVLEPIDAW